MSAGVPPVPEVESPPVAGDRRSRILGGGGGRSVAVAVVSTVIFFAVLVFVVVSSPGWPEVRRAFFNWELFRESFPEIARTFLRNVIAFSVAEVLILVVALAVAVLRSLPGPVFFPIRALAVVYTDLFRGIPLILVLYMIGFGVPGLGLNFVSEQSDVTYGIVALVLVYSAYVAEVYRAGIDSVHESQVGAARSLGLSRWKSMRYVVLPQAVRRVIPPLLNDFIGLQKDTALVSVLGSIEAARAAQIYGAEQFNYASYVIAALLFVLITIPLARFTDHLIARDRRRRQAGALT